MSNPTDVDPAAPANRCYRHPDRESFVRCQRCGRTICPQCQTPAAVGVHCPECMKESRRDSAAPSVLTRARRAVGPGSTRPVVTYSIIAINVFVFILELLTGNPIMGNGSGSVVNALFFIPGSITVEPWRIVTSAFIHANLIHIALNMYMLFILGVPLERYIGKARFTAVYLIGAIGGSAGVEFLTRNGALGASGAVFTVLAVLILLARQIGINPTQLIIIGVINVVYGFIQPGISWQGHFGGLISGVLLGLLFIYTRPIRRRPLQIAGLIALPILILVAMLAHTLIAFGAP